MAKAFTVTVVRIVREGVSSNGTAFKTLIVKREDGAEAAIAYHEPRYEGGAEEFASVQVGTQGQVYRDSWVDETTGAKREATRFGLTAKVDTWFD